VTDARPAPFKSEKTPRREAPPRESPRSTHKSPEKPAFKEPPINIDDMVVGGGGGSGGGVRDYSGKCIYECWMGVELSPEHL
jgi:hypothetical protein